GGGRRDVGAEDGPRLAAVLAPEEAVAGADPERRRGRGDGVDGRVPLDEAARPVAVAEVADGAPGGAVVVGDEEAVLAGNVDRARRAERGAAAEAEVVDPAGPDEHRLERLAAVARDDDTERLAGLGLRRERAPVRHP